MRFSLRHLRRLWCSTPTLLLLVTGCLSLNTPTELQEAEELKGKGDYDLAITAYQEHIDERLRDGKRPEWENPYFHLLAIGDIELSRGKVDQAIANYTEAERQGVDAALISDRYRAVATWYEENNQLKNALDILTKYRDRDPLLFDSMLDRVARKLTEQEAGPRP